MRKAGKKGRSWWSAAAVFLALGALVQASEIPVGRPKQQPPPPAISASEALELGKSLYRRGQYDQALPHFLTVLKLEPGHAAALYYQRRSSEEMLKIKEENIRRKEKALWKASDVWKERARQASAHCEAGREALKAGDLYRATQLFNQIKMIFPNDECARAGLEKVQEAFREKKESVRVSTAPAAATAATPAPPKPAAPLPSATDIRKLREAILEQKREPPAAKPAPPPPPRWAVPVPAPAPKPAEPAEPEAPPRPPTQEEIEQSHENYLLGVAAYMQKDNAEAVGKLKESVRLNPSNKRAKTLLQRIEEETAP